jgi:hypothetical protein
MSREHYDDLDHSKQSAFSASRRPDERNEFTRPNVERNMIESEHRWVAGLALERDGHVLEADAAAPL